MSSLKLDNLFAGKNLMPVIFILLGLTCFSLFTKFYNLGHRSLYYDEAGRVQNFRSGKANYDPPLYAYFRKLIPETIGYSEVSLRSTSAVLGSMAVPVTFVSTTIITGNPIAGIFASALVLSDGRLFERSRSLKIYGTEYFAMSLLILFMAIMLRYEYSHYRMLICGILISVAIGCGHGAALLALPTLAFVAFWKWVADRQNINKAWMAAYGTILIVVVMAVYIWYQWVSSAAGDNKEGVYSFYENYGHIPMEGATLWERLVWGVGATYNYLTWIFPPEYKPGKILAVLSWLLAVWGIYKWPRGSRFYLYWLLCVILGSILLGFLRLYPWGSVRNLECHSAMFMLLPAYGFCNLVNRFVAWKRGALVILIIFAFAFEYTRQIYRSVVSPMATAHVRPLIEKLETDSMPSDRLFLYYCAEAHFEFYWSGNKQLKDIIWMQQEFERWNWKAWDRFLQTLPYAEDRLWLLFNHEADANESNYVRAHFDKHGYSYEVFEEAQCVLLLLHPKDG